MLFFDFKPFPKAIFARGLSAKWKCSFMFSAIGIVLIQVCAWLNIKQTTFKLVHSLITNFLPIAHLSLAPAAVDFLISQCCLLCERAEDFSFQRPKVHWRPLVDSCHGDAWNHFCHTRSDLFITFFLLLYAYLWNTWGFFFWKMMPEATVLVSLVGRVGGGGARRSCWRWLSSGL